MSDTQVASGQEIGRVWNTIGREMKPRPEWFDERGRNAVGQMGYDHVRVLKREWQDQQYALPQAQRKTRWSMRPWFLVGEGIAIGIKIGIQIERNRHANDT